MAVLLIVTFIGGIIFSVINFYRGLWPLASIGSMISPRVA
ncbi:hypothetical protein GMES_3430 [Paraglaciecola mesophila KMM 241]|uniref:Uncharacterized protein n=1 Tax=Paraglaciecola mesophila KMM 241 TaxID=1128912 RepID=K6Z5N6_9ALTE|nr:hypothetical protein GMES_3430 [Paraglaciecola mesophila KMM 241]